jgi:hypothetical protein
MSWNQGRAEIDRLLADGELQRVPPNREHADQLFSQARKDLASAELLLDANPKRAYESLYDAARMALTCWRHGEQTFAWNWRFRGRRCLPRRGRGGPSHRGHGWRGGLPGSPRPRARTVPGDMMINWASSRLRGKRPLSLCRPPAWPCAARPVAADSGLAGAGRGCSPSGEFGCDSLTWPAVSRRPP